MTQEEIEKQYEKPPKEVSTFNEYDVKELKQKQKHDNIVGNIYIKMQQIRLEDIEWRVTKRKKYGRYLIGLLTVQNIIIFALVIYAYYQNRIQDIQAVFLILVPATLAETAYTVKIIIQWLFSDIDYNLKKLD